MKEAVGIMHSSAPLPDSTYARRRSCFASAGHGLKHIGRVLVVAVLALSAFAPLDAAEVVPSELLRPWDAVTFFFDKPHPDAAPAPDVGGQPLDPSRVFVRWPRHPGAFNWIDDRTLEFRPSEPWPALSVVDFELDGERVRLATMLDAPTSTLPQAGGGGLAPFDQLELSFPAPVDADTLRAQLEIAVRAAGDDGAGEPIDGARLSVKTAALSGSAGTRARITLPATVTDGQTLLVQLKLARGEAVPRWRAHFTTREPFRAVAFGCVKARFPVAAGGSHYPASTPLTCQGGRRLAVEFSTALDSMDFDTVRDLVRVSPRVENLQFRAHERMLLIDGAFAPDVNYTLSLHPAPAGAERLLDTTGRALEQDQLSSMALRFPRRADQLRWGAASGVLERFGPKQVPLLGRGEQQMDLRVHAVDPLDRSFWPFPAEPVAVDDRDRPPGPGEAPRPHERADEHITPAALAAQIQALRAPAYSALVAAGTRDGATARFGFDLTTALQSLSGGINGAAVRPGAYLLGLRRPGAAEPRRWMRIQVTDLALTTLAGPDHVRFLVTSLRSGSPVPGAVVTVEGTTKTGGWHTLGSGETNVLGQWQWRAGSQAGGRIMRIVARYGDDQLVLNPNRPPERFANGRWQAEPNTWLQWTRARASDLAEKPTRHCHLFSERPVYKPGEAVHLKGWLRARSAGRFAPVLGDGHLIVVGPGDREWRVPTSLSDSGTFYHQFAEPKLPTGTYWAAFEYADWGRCGGFEFKLEDYQVPELEVSVHAPDVVPIDRPFDVRMTARYYAGGQVASRPLAWRVTQFPYTWAPKTLPGFVFSSVSRYGNRQPLASEAVVNESRTTDATGADRLQVDPAVEPSARARRYVIEATVTGNDGRTITATRQVLGLPALALGLKAPAVLRNSTPARIEAVALDAQGRMKSGEPLTLRLLRRDWHAHLRAGDHGSGTAKYITEAVDTEIASRALTSGDGPVPVEFELPGRGVYIVQLEARDGLGRLQTVQTDFFANGDARLAWPRAPARLLKAVADKTRYAPGESARIVLQSPYQFAHALMVVEGPAGNRYEWIDIRGGSATVEVPVLHEHTPRLPVHFVVLRGRVGAAPADGQLDLGRPATVAGSVNLSIAADTHRVEVALQYPRTARPGTTVPVTIRLSDERGRALAGEVSLWLVDQAVLALGKERRLDPLRDFVKPRNSRLHVHDTRNRLFGYLPYRQHPGGGSADEEPLDLLDNVTPRKRFVPVPFYAPSISVDASGEAVVQVELPDNLTVFKLRAKVLSGVDRFGFATGALAVRVPLVVQPAMPSFVRPGDRFDARATVRVVDGPVGAGTWRARVSAGDQRVDDDGQVDLSRAGTQLSVPVAVPSGLRVGGGASDASPTDPDSRAAALSVTFAVARSADQATDAFSVAVPVRPDRRVRIRRTDLSLQPGAVVPLPPLGEAARAGTLQRTLLVSPEIELLRLAGAASFLRTYPYGCTEQRISKAQATLSLQRFSARTGALANTALAADAASDLQETFAWIDGAFDDRELVAFWPGSRGFVSLTAWALQLAVAARDAGIEVPEGLAIRLVRSLRRALRSDFPAFAPDSAFAERAWALTALADAGLADAAYAAELARQAQFLPLESLAQVVRVLLQTQRSGRATALEPLWSQLRNGVRTRLADGQQRYLGLSESATASRLILPTEARTLAELLRTAVVADLAADGGTAEARPMAQRDLLRDALLGLADNTGWGDTNANAAALGALLQVLDAPDGQVQLEMQVNAVTEQLSTAGALLRRTWTDERDVRLSNGDRRLLARLEDTYVPADPGAEAGAEADGFVVTRYWLMPDAVGGNPARALLDAPGLELAAKAGQVVEEVIELVNPQRRYHVVLAVPLAAGMELLNPALQTAPPEATPSEPDTLAASYQDRRADEVRWYFNALPAGRHVFRIRTRATVPGQFNQPPAYAQAMYNESLRGASNGAWVRVSDN
ncbi:MAG: alpha-2-macroglobulin family protein [Pseudomonadota bacterium]